VKRILCRACCVDGTGPYRGPVAFEPSPYLVEGGGTHCLVTAGNNAEPDIATLYVKGLQQLQGNPFVGCRGPAATACRPPTTRLPSGCYRVPRLCGYSVGTPQTGYPVAATACRGPVALAPRHPTDRLPCGCRRVSRPCGSSVSAPDKRVTLWLPQGVEALWLQRVRPCGSSVSRPDKRLTLSLPQRVEALWLQRVEAPQTAYPVAATACKALWLQRVEALWL
jgi:hypothetical protein